MPGTLGEGVECCPLIVSVSRAEQDTGRDHEKDKLPVVSMWVCSGLTQQAWLLRTLPPVRLSSQEALEPGRVPCVSWTVNQEAVVNWQGCSVLSSHGGEG